MVKWLLLIVLVCLAGVAIAFGVFFLASTASVGQDVKQEYERVDRVAVEDVGDPNYPKLVVGNVFFTAYLRGTNQDRYSGGPPFRVVLGAFLLDEAELRVDIVSAIAVIDDNFEVDLLSSFESVSAKVGVKPDRSDNEVAYGSLWLKSDYALFASPEGQESVTLVFDVNVTSRGGDSVGGQLVFEFDPKVTMTTRGGLPL